jgi:predicted 2-oxoglutarate/Fe(II)-dependent dioxygenase YbiX
MIEEIRRSFEENGYAYISNFLDLQSCRDVTSEFYKLREEGRQNIGDTQSPNSDSFGHEPAFDSLLEQLTPNVESIVQRKLYPTYGYGRIYKPGADLAFHKDRDSCEVSMTITLNFRGNPWPIYMCKNENDRTPVNMEIGDAVLYKGCDITHGRETYTQGEEQVQIFLHWVYQDGDRAEWKWDKRKKLAHHTDDHKSKILNWNGLYWELPEVFTKEACKQLITKFESGNEDKYEPGYIGQGHERIIDKKVRDVNRIITSPAKGIGATLTGIGLNANNHLWKFDLTHSNQVEFLKYNKDGHFHTHIDTFLGEVDCKWSRKLSVLLFLNDDYEGGKFFLPGAEGKIYPSQNQGDIVIFPSFLSHGVEPVQSGIRRTIITWLVGPYFK